MRLLFHIVLALLSVFLVYATVVPWVHTNAWWVRIFDFPRLQFATGMVLALAGYSVLWWRGGFSQWVFLVPGLVAASLVWQLVAIAPYTPLFPYEVGDSDHGPDSGTVSLLISNVLYKNRDASKLRQLIRDTDPDIILLTEPTQWWNEQLDDLQSDYPHTVLQPQENHYGMLLYSRLELVDPEVRFLVEPTVPSIRTGVRLRSGQVVRLYGVHPRPPGLEPPGENDRENSDLRDAELMQIAREVSPLEDTPVIVAGDFNDVAWSRTTHLFQRVGGFLDPRVGRGMYNTFDSESYVLRYPLDHVFVSDHFRLIELQRLPNIGSDHFPMLATLDYHPTNASEQDEPRPDADDQQDAEEAIEEGQESAAKEPRNQ